MENDSCSHDRYLESPVARFCGGCGANLRKESSSSRNHRFGGGTYSGGAPSKLQRGYHEEEGLGDMERRDLRNTAILTTILAVANVGVVGHNWAQEGNFLGVGILGVSSSVLALAALRCKYNPNLRSAMNGNS